jgi:hypothetical protein
MNIFVKFVNKIKKSLKNLDTKNLKIMRYGLGGCFLIVIISMAILITYLFLVHNILIYQIGLLVFQVALYFSADFIVSALAIDIIQKQTM